MTNNINIKCTVSYVDVSGSLPLEIFYTLIIISFVRLARGTLVRWCANDLYIFVKSVIRTKYNFYFYNKCSKNNFLFPARSFLVDVLVDLMLDNKPTHSLKTGWLMKFMPTNGNLDQIRLSYYFNLMHI